MAEVGALPLVLITEVSQRLLNVMFGFATAAMLAATEFSLIQPDIEEAGGGAYEALVMLVGILLGAVSVHFFDKRLPLKHFIQGREGPESGLSGVWLFVLAITLHNLPEALP